MLTDNVLVLGSKPESKLPDIEVSKIYTANGAAERAIHYREKYKNNELICVTGASEFVRNDHVSKRIIKSKPNRLIIRSGIISPPKDLNGFSEIKCIPNFEQWCYQSAFFKFSYISLFFSEFCHQNGVIKKIYHVAKAIKNKKIQGISSGFYAVLLALEENPRANIIISGIGMQGGKQFYKSERSNLYVYDSRAKVDRFLVSILHERFQKRLRTLNKELSSVSRIGNWIGPSF